MKKEDLVEEITKKQSYLCVGLDTAVEKLPHHLPKNAEGVLRFNQAIIEATQEYAVAYKLNTAFYEALGAKGWEVLQKTREMLPKNTFNIADAKRGDIGNTSKMYAKAFLELMDFDAITVAPYMGEDSVKPFLMFKDKWVILLALTSNIGSKDFQQLSITATGEKLYQNVLETSKKWASASEMMYVVGATQAEYLAHIRKQVPNHFLLVPGVGAQGGSLEEVSKAALNSEVGLLVNSSRGIIYASSNEDFATVAANQAKKLQQQMQKYLQQKKKR